MHRLSIPWGCLRLGGAVVWALCAGLTLAAEPDALAPIQSLLAKKDFAGGRAALEAIVGDTNRAPALRGLAQLRAAQSWLLENKPAEARTAYLRVQQMAGVPEHFVWEARRRAKELERVAAGKPMREPEESRVAASRMVPAEVTFYVAPNGSDQNPGTVKEPFASLKRARDAIRAHRERKPFREGGAVVMIRGGDYRAERSLKLDSQDSGLPLAPIIYRAYLGEQPRFIGGVRLTGFKPVTDPEILARLPEEARGKVVQVDLDDQVAGALPPLVLGGFASGHGFKTHPAAELYCDGQAMPMARWPNEGYVRVAGLSGPKDVNLHGKTGSRSGVFTYEGDRPARWAGDTNAFLYGYWFWDWADSYERLEQVDPVKREITLAKPWHTYGFRQGARFYAVHVLAEIDRPGEWYLDRGRRRLYWYPTRNPAEATVELSLLGTPFVQMENVSHVRFQKLQWELGAADGVIVRGGRDCLLAGCVVRRLAGNGVEIHGGTGHGILSCDIYSMGRGGTVISGGDRKTLLPGSHFAENNHIHELSRIDHTYTPAIVMSGVGNRIAHNLMHHINSSAIRLNGNDHLVELNEVHHALLESDDQGGADMWGDATFRGNVYRYNYWHHLGAWQKEAPQPDCGQAGIRLDDAISGMLIYGNIFYRCASGKLGFGAVQIHGGKDNILDNNLFADCRWGVSFSPWGQSGWKNFTAKAMDSPEIDRALYLARYPDLTRLSEEADVNHVWRNLVWNCGQFLFRGKAREMDNWVTTEDCAFAQAARGDFRIQPDSKVWERLSFDPIPFEDIGLYQDIYRKSLPVSEISAARSE